MIVGKIKPGEGIGDMLFSYILTRVIALDKGLDFGFVGSEFFKGSFFMNLDFGKPINLKYKIIPESGDLILEDESKTFIVNTPYYNPEINFVQDGAVLDGYGAQSEQYWGHRLDEIKEWLKTYKYPKSEEESFKADECVINFRGGEYKTVPELYLPLDYWREGMMKMIDKEPNIKFQAHTDDPEEVKRFFGSSASIYKDIETNWLAVRYAKNAIISNSAFAIIPRLLKHLEDPEAVTIAPFGWNARNTSLKEWKGRPGNYYKVFKYI